MAEEGMHENLRISRHPIDYTVETARNVVVAKYKEPKGQVESRGDALLLVSSVATALKFHPHSERAMDSDTRQARIKEYEKAMLIANEQNDWSGVRKIVQSFSRQGFENSAGSSRDEDPQDREFSEQEGAEAFANLATNI